LGAEVYYNVHRWYEHGVGRYGRVDPLGLGAGLANTFLYTAANPVVALDPQGLKTCVAFVVGGFLWHVAFFTLPPCRGPSTPDTDEPFLYDPAGSYRSQTRGSGDTLYGDEANTKDWEDYHSDPPKQSVEWFCFDTTCCEEQELRRRAESQPSTPGGLCANSVSACLKGVGPFRDIGGTIFPSSLRRKLAKLHRAR
jgi:uncharacterized protein RhaS with RHS repeats